MPACCPSCHAIARAGGRCALCGAATVPLAELATSRVAGLALDVAPPPGKGRGAGTMLGTTALMIGGALAGNAAAGTLGALVGFGLGLSPYWSHLWRPRLVRTRRLDALPDPPGPAMPPAVRYIGTAQLLEHTVPSPMTPKRRVLAATTLVRASGEQATYFCRAVTAVPFWLVTPEGRRMLVTGSCWVAPTAYASVAENGARTLTRLDVPSAMVPPASGFEARISPGDAIAAIGVAREEAAVGMQAGGYRDEVVTTLRGEPGQPIWLERL